jgi:hypothetical protein
MSLKRFDPKRDTNDLELSSAAKRMGWFLVYCDTPCDYFGALLARPEFGFFAIEIKNGELARLSEAQRFFHLECTRMRLPHLIWRSLDDVIESTNKLRAHRP